MRTHSLYLLACGVVVLGSLPGMADTIYLTNGTEVEGTVTSENSKTVEIRLANGQTRSFRRADVDSIVKDSTADSDAPKKIELKSEPAKTDEAAPAPVDKPKPEPVAAPASRLEGWTESWSEAAAAARASQKPIMADFTGSDWCKWCIKQDKEVFETPEFQEWARKNVVLLKLDFPRKTAQDAAIKKQNDDLAQKYKVTGFPTLLFLDADGKLLGRKGGYGDKDFQSWAEAVGKIITTK